MSLKDTAIYVSKKGGNEKMWNKYKSVAVTYFVLKLLMVLTVALLFFIPFFVSLYCETVSPEYLPLTKYWLIATLYASVVPVAISEICLDRLILNVKKDIVFVPENVKYMRYTSWCCFVIGIIFFFLGFRILLAFAIAAAAAMVGLILRVIKNVFAEAVVIKSENDLTI